MSPEQARKKTMRRQRMAHTRPSSYVVRRRRRCSTRGYTHKKSNPAHSPHVCPFPLPQSFRGLYPFPVAHPYDGQSMVDFDAPDMAAWPLFSKARRPSDRGAARALHTCCPSAE